MLTSEGVPIRTTYYWEKLYFLILFLFFVIFAATLIYRVSHTNLTESPYSSITLGVEIHTSNMCR